MNAAFVTGVCGGIGRAVAESLVARGWRVYGVDIDTDGTPPAGIEFDQIDVSNDASRRGAFGGIGRLHDVSALVNVAAIQIARPFDQTDEDVWWSSLRTNLIGPAELTRLLLPALRVHRGAVVNVASVHARATSPGLIAYAVSKAGLAGLTRALAVELAEDGIRVNAVLPGAVDTRMLHEGLERADDPRDALDELLRRTPMRRLGTPEDISAIVSFLIEDSSRFVTGQEFVADGGVLAALSSEGVRVPSPARPDPHPPTSPLTGVGAHPGGGHP